MVVRHPADTGFAAGPQWVMPTDKTPRLPHPDDLTAIRRFRQLVALRSEELCNRVEEELGKPSFETLMSEIAPLFSACRFVERRARRVLRARTVRGGSIWQLGQRHRVVRVPLGNVAIIATWNYPLQLLGVQLVHALAGGNRVVVKPSERSPASQSMLLELAAEAGFGSDRLETRPEDREAGRRLIENERFDHVVFTGSTGVGKAIARTLADTLTPSTLELSGSDSAIVLEDADVRIAARSIVFALLLNAGQTCMVPRRVIAVGRAYEPLVEHLTRAVSTPRQTTRADPEGMQNCRAAIEAAVAAGGRRIAGGLDGPAMLVAECPVDSALFRGEHFGPGLALVRAETLDEALMMHRQVEKKLATAVFTSSPARARRLSTGLGSTVVTINDCVLPTGHPGLSIGGIGSSGWGLTRGQAGLLSMTRPVFVTETPGRLRTPLDEPGERVRRRIAGFVRWMYG